MNNLLTMKIRWVLQLFLLLLITGVSLIAFYSNTLKRVARRRARMTNKQTHNAANRPPVTTVVHHTLTNNVIIVNSTHGTMTSRISQLNDVISIYRRHLVVSKNYTRNIQMFEEKKSIIINGDDYLIQLAHIKYIVTVALPWQQTQDNVNPNLVIQKYFPWTANKFLCQLIEQRSIFPDIYVKVFRKMPCNQDIKKATTANTLNYGHLKAHGGKHFADTFYTTPPSWILFVHVIAMDSLITSNGHVISGGIKLTCDYCGRVKDKADTVELNQIPQYDEVFTMKHPPGGAVYHGLLEEIPRVAPFIEFLERHQNIMIHATADRRGLEMLNILGFNKSRVISGPVKARIVYLPRHAFCMIPRVVETQLLSRHYRSYIVNNLPTEQRNRILLVLRTHNRKFERQSHVQTVVKHAANKFNLRYTEFKDNPLPTMNSTMSMFHSSIMVVAAHGAGLSNIVFCQQDTFIIEIVPYARITPLCYLHVAHSLGFHWHGLPSRYGRFKVTQVNLNALHKVITEYLSMETQK